MKYHNSKKQQGTVLVFSLVMLLALTLVAVGTFDRVTLDEKIAGNLRDKNVAMQRSEVALREGEQSLSALILPPTPNTNSGSLVWPLGEQGGGSYDGTLNSSWVLNLTESWWDNNANTALNTTDSEYFIEEQEMKPDSLALRNNYAQGRSATYYYRVSARSEGQGSGLTVVQSTYAKRFN